ncbi:[protein-PII] uridylyltransferase family protein, partial [Fangia hongkongensis]
LIESFYPHLENISVIAIGGYGRKERSLYSDLDILFLAKDEEALKNTALLSFIDVLQSLPVKLGYIVHTLQSLQADIQHHYEFLTALLDARLITGDKTLFASLEKLLADKKNLPNIQSFFDFKYHEQLQRDKKYPINQQPDLKKTIGNLRYLQMIHWLFCYIHPNKALAFLVDHGYIQAHEMQLIKKAHRFLSAIRFYLHILHQRDEDRLLLNAQDEVAKFFCPSAEKEATANARIEKFMQRYYQIIRDIKLINRIILSGISQHFENEIPSKINDHLSLHANTICSSDKSYPRNIDSLLEPFYYLCQHHHALMVDANILRNIHHLIETTSLKEIADNTKLQSDFLDLFASPYNLKSALSLMTDIGLLEAIIPEFSQAKGQMQFDLYHKYTVDRHTIETVNNIRDICEHKYKESFPLVDKCIQNHPNIKVLYLAALFHDIGKGLGKDHSITGARIFTKYAIRWQLKANEIRLGAWLIEHHLSLSSTIKKQDIFDIDVIENFAEFVRTQKYLDSLVILTFADMKATNDLLWRDWQQNAVSNLYNNVTYVLNNEKNRSRNSEIKTLQNTLKEGLTCKNAANILPIWHQLPARYFLEQPLSVLRWQTKILSSEGILNGKLTVNAHYDSDTKQSMMLITGLSEKSPLSFIAQFFSSKALNIRDAKIFQPFENQMIYHFTINTFAQKNITQQSALTQIAHDLSKALNEDLANYQYKETKTAEIPEHTRIPTKVSIESPSWLTYNKVVIKTADKVGLLAKLCHFFESNGFKIIRARIYTSGIRAEDHFYICDLQDKKLTNKAKIAQLETALYEMLQSE